VLPIGHATHRFGGRARLGGSVGSMKDDRHVSRAVVKKDL
jgi:hypothetical protein